MAYEELFDQAGRQFNVDPALLRAQMKIESGGKLDARSEKGAEGPMQLMPETQQALGVTNPNDPRQAIFGAARLMAENLDRYGNVADAVRAYHGGTDQANWGPKTQAYARNVVSAYTGAPASAAAPGMEDFAAADFTDAPGVATAAEDDFAAQDFADVAPPTASARAPGVSEDIPNAGQVIAPTSSGQASEQSGFNPLSLAEGFGKYAVNNTIGALRGVRDVVDAPVEWLAKGSEASGLTGLLGKAGINMMTGDQQVQANKDRRAAYEQQYGDSLASDVGRFGGQALGAMVPVGGTQAALVRGGNQLLGAMRASPVASGLAPAAERIGSFLAGNGGLASRAANLGLQGAGGAALLSGASDTPLTEQLGTGALLGAAIPVVGRALSGVGNAGRSAVRAVTNPFTETGRQRAAEQLIGEEARAAASTANPLVANQAAGAPSASVGALLPEDALGAAARGGRTAANFDEIIPGSRPTLAQATGNAGIAALERAAQSRAPNAFNELQQANNAARADFFNGIRGNSQTLEQAITQREEAAMPLLEQALTNRRPANANPVMEEIDSILKSPSGQRDAVVSAMNRIKSKLDLGKDGLQSDAAQLYGIRKSINDQLTRVAGKDNSEAQLASKELLQVKSALDDVIEDAAPQFKEYLKQYASLSKPVTSQDYLQSLDLMDQTNTAFSLNKVKSALNKIDKARKAPGASEAKDLSDEQLQGLRALYADLKREANSGKGMGRGSNTFQNLATNQLIEAMGGNSIAGTVSPSLIGGGLGYLMGGPVGAGAGGAIGGAIGNSVSSAIRNRAPDVEAKLINLLLNPNGATALKALEEPATRSILNNQLLQRAGTQGGAAAGAGSTNNR